jgi:hypothetical protein
MKKLSLLFAFLLYTAAVFAQASGYIEGKVTKGGVPVKDVTVEAREGGILKGSDKTDAFGKYTIKPLSSGDYEVRFSKNDLKTINEYATVSAGSGMTQNAVMVDKTATQVNKVIVDGGKRPRKKLVIDVVTGGQSTAVNSVQIERQATTNTVDAIKIKSGVYQRKSGEGVSIGGGRAENTVYLIDGIMVRGGNVQVPIGAVAEISVSTGGMPANLGDATGGVVTITTKGTASKHTGSINAQHSIDGYNNNQLTVNLRGPLYKKKTANTSRTILGYSISGTGQYDVDNDPSYYKYYTISDAKKAELQASPLRAVKSPSGAVFFRSAAEFLLPEDMQRVKARLNGTNKSLNLQGKLSFAPTKEIEITAGGSAQMSANPSYSNANSILAPEANALNNFFLGRGYLRFRQTLSKAPASGIKPLIGKAFYQVQLNYEKSFSSSRNSKHKDDVFKYGYLGKFKQYSRNFYALDTVAGGYRALKFITPINDSLTFTPDNNTNPNYTAYTNYVYNNLENNPFSAGQLLQLGGTLNGGTVNGGMVNNIFGLFSNVGSAVGGLSKSQVEQYSLNVDASFDINTGIKRSEKLKIDMEARHAIEFGFYYEQRLNRNYGLSANNLWTLMRGLTNAHLTDLDLSNPIFRVDGKDYTLTDVQNGLVTVTDFDTVNYNRKLSAESPEAYFSKQLRQSLGLGANNRDFLEIDDLDPNKLNLNMFSADDLLNSGNQNIVAYSGYDHLGNKVSGRPSLADFWTKKDANGNYARPITPFNPIYVAGYIQDNFKFKDIQFRIGVRVDRYDANQKVLRNQYSMFATKKVSDLQTGKYALSTDQADGTAPDPLRDADFNAKFKDAEVYVANNDEAKPKIVGYRVGDNWFDPFGRQIADPNIINAKYTNGSQLAPYIADPADNAKGRIKSENYNINAAFTDYKPRINISPRLTFSFPVDRNAAGNVTSLFYAHYDVVTQRPSAGFINASPDDYYFIQERGQSQTLANANLGVEKKVDYELGFKQQLSAASQLRLSAAYIERKDQVQLQQIIAAYPISYQTYGNRDFSSVKQFTAEYELRPDRFPFEMTLAYTLQFAEGTGSSATSQRGLLASGLPNLRVVQPLDIDSRHTIVLNADYRLGADSGRMGPRIGKIYPFKSTGINFTFAGRSGEPYTRAAQVSSLTNGFSGAAIEGSLNGSRRPWTVNLDTRIDKDITFFGKGKKLEDGSREKGKAFRVNLYAYSQNLLNTRNVLALYGYTGSADNDGYVASPQGKVFASTISTSAQSWENYYNIAVLNPGRFVNPRRIYVGFNFNF